MNEKSVKKIIAWGAALTVASSAVCLFADYRCSLICLLLGSVLTVIYACQTKKRYKALSELNDYLSLVCSGNYDLSIDENAEGELSILKNNLFKVITLLKFQNEALEKEKIYLADSMADISHQLKTPLTSMMVMNDLIKEENDAEKRQEFIAIIEAQLERMKWLILNLLKLSKLDAGTADFKTEKVSAAKIIDKSLKPFLVTMELKGISVNTNINDFQLNADENWTVEAFQNIIKNCMEHTDKDGEISISSYSTNIYDSVVIKDNGCGIAKEDLPHIFERFYHGKNSSKESVGIGLALAKTVFEREKAAVTVKSKECVGTTFEIKFYKGIV